MNDKTKKMVITALLMALTWVATMLAIPLPMGYINLGDAIVFLSGLLLGPTYGFVSGGVGAALADFTLGFPQYIITTLLVKGLMGFIAGKVRDKDTMLRTLFCILAGLIMVFGYYLTDVFIYSNWIAPLAMIPMNILQFGVGLLLATLLRKVVWKYRFS